MARMKTRGMRHRPINAAAMPGMPPIFVPTNTAMFTWLAPGMIRHIVMALRNSSSPIQFFSTTSTSRDQAESPPPNEASAMWLNVHASSNSETFSRRDSISLMPEVFVVRKVVLVVLAGIDWIRRVIVMRKVPVRIENVPQPGDNVRVGYRDAQFPTQIEGTTVDIHRTKQRPLLVRDQQLRVDPQVLLFVHLDAEAAQRAQRCEGVENVPIADAVPAAAQNVHLDPAISGSREVIENDRVDIFRVLNIQSILGAVDELGHVITRIRVTPEKPLVGRACPVEVLPISVEHLGDLRNVLRIVRDDSIVAGQREVFGAEIEGGDQRGFLVRDN